MSSNEAFFRARIDEPLRDTGWWLTDGKSLRGELPVGPHQDRVRPPRPARAGSSVSWSRVGSLTADLPRSTIRADSRAVGPRLIARLRLACSARLGFFHKPPIAGKEARCWPSR